LSAELSRFLCRPIVFREPDRVVHPPSWLEHIPFAFWIVEAVRPGVLAELGTQSGNSYSAFAQAVQMLGLSATAYAVDTWQGDSQAGFYDESVYEEWSRYHDRHFGSFSRLVRSTFDAAATHFPDGAIDLLHIDGCHTYEAVTGDFERWLPKLSRRAVVLLHDVNVRERDFGAWRFWEDWKDRFPSFEFLHGHGLGVLATGADMSEPVRWLCATSPADALFVREFFARLGGAISARFEREQQQASLTGQIAARDATIATLAGESVHLREQAAALADERARLAREVQALEAERQRLRQTAATVEAAAADLAAAREAAAYRTVQIGELREQLNRERLRRRELEEHGAPSPSGGAAAAEAAGTRSRARAGRTPGKSALMLLRHPRSLRDARIIRASGLFNAEYYTARYPDVVGSGLAPLTHFVLHGAFEGRSPHPLFDTAYYLRRNPDVAAAGINPLVHYRQRGVVERRSPHPLFDVDYYLTANPDVAAAGLDPLAHFLSVGAAEGRNPNPFFDCAFYRTQQPDAGTVNPLVHFDAGGWQSARPSAAFDSVHYVARYEDVRRSGGNPLAHFLEWGRAEGRVALPDGTLLALHSEADDVKASVVRLQVRSLEAAGPGGPATVLVATPFVPLRDGGGNEFRVYRLLHWLARQQFRIVVVIAAQPDDLVDAGALRGVAAEFANAILCRSDGHIDFILDGLPDVLSSMSGDFPKPAALLLEENAAAGDRRLLRHERTICHDTVVTTLMRLQHVLGRSAILAESIWMTRALPLLSTPVVKIVDTACDFDRVIDPGERAVRLARADVIVAIDDAERDAIQALVPDRLVVAAGIDCDPAGDAGTAAGHKVVCAAPDTPSNRKGLADFLRFVWPRVRRDVIDAELVVAGGLAGSVEPGLPGVVLEPSTEQAALYRDARVAISPSLEESGLRREVLEAIAHQRPVVTWASSSQGIPSRLGGLYVEARDWFEFARQLQAVLVSDASPAAASPSSTQVSPYEPLFEALRPLIAQPSASGTPADVRG